MSKYRKIDHHPSMDPDIWEAYEKVWTFWQERKAMFEGRYHFHGSEEIEGKIDILEELLQRHIGAQYLRAGEPMRIMMKDVIAYHEKLDRQYLST
jgi:hypothetical protein